MRVLITGASGFLGRPCLLLLRARGHGVLALSRHPRPTGIDEGVQWHVADLNDADSYEPAIRGFAPESALHLAWEGIPDYGLTTSLRNTSIGCVLGDVLFKAGCRHLAVSGSCWEYGKVSGLVKETDAPVAPDVFGAAKASQRLMLDALARAAGATLAWGRVFYPYGPAQKATSLAPALCRAVLAGDKPVLKTPHAVNDFIYVDDAAEALVVLTEAMISGIFNIGSGTGTAVGAMADALLELADHPAVFRGSTAANCELKGFWADTAALKSLGWRTKTPLGEGLRRTLAFFRESRATC